MKVKEFLHVPYGKTVHGEEEIEAVVHVLRTSTQMGKHVREFEKKVSALFNKKYGVMLNSGSSANYLAVELLNLKKGSEVITPALTFSTTVAPIIKNRLKPAFVDVEDGTYNLDVSKVEEMITRETRAMIIPNLIGNLPNWNILYEIAGKYNLKIIEDSADTLGATINGVSSGKKSDISNTSFYGSHVINCAGNGGMMCINDDQLYHKSLLLRSWGRSSSVFIESEKIENRFNVQLEGINYDSKFVFEELGYNMEPSEMGAAFGLVQLTKLNDNIKKREHNFNDLYSFFSDYEKWIILPKQLIGSKTGWLAFAITIRENAPFTRTELQIFLEKRGIQTRTIFTGNVLRQPGFINIHKKVSNSGYPCADRVMKGGMLVGCHHGMNSEMLAHIKVSFEEFASNY